MPPKKRGGTKKTTKRKARKPSKPRKPRRKPVKKHKPAKKRAPTRKTKPKTIVVKRRTQKSKQTQNPLDSMAIINQLRTILHQSETTPNLTRAYLNILLVMYKVRRLIHIGDTTLDPNALRLFVGLLNDWQLVPGVKLDLYLPHVSRDPDQEAQLSLHAPYSDAHLARLYGHQCADDPKRRNTGVVRRMFDISVERGKFNDQLFVEPCSDEFMADWLERGVDYHMKLVDEYAKVLELFGYRPFLLVTEIVGNQRRLLFDSRKK